MKKAIAACVFVSMFFVVSTVNANTITSSTLVFESAGGYTLTDNGDGTYSGILPAKVNCGFDIFAKSGSTAWFGNDAGSGPVWTDQAIAADHDAWPTWTPDTPDWYQYSIEFYAESGVQKWALRNHPGSNATESDPWYDDGDGDTAEARGVPMSGTMDWTAMYAAETDTGAYLPGTGTAEIPGGAAGQGGGAQCWDMDWSWGSEVVPLEYAGFSVDITLCAGNYMVCMTPAPEPSTFVLLGLGALSLILVRRKH